MSHDATVNAGDIARLVDVGRAAVSNWRRRHEDFPRPVGGTASSPLFSLREVEDWLRRNGKLREVSLAEWVWQRLRASGDDLGLGGLVARAGAFLLELRRAGESHGLPVAALDDPELTRPLTDLAAERGHVEAFEFLCLRYVQAHSRRLFVTPEDVAALMARLVGADRAEHGTILDPACGLGTLLLAAPAARVVGQEADETAAAITAVRLMLRGTPSAIVAGDSLRQDGFADELADAVVCDPPFNERAWGYNELAGDPRWEYGLPPRGESELAWVQHCLAHVKPGGLVAVLMPSAAASRRPGKRIRGNLLRAGALRAVVTLPAGGPDLWLLRRPEAGRQPPSRILLMEASGDLAAVDTAWRRYLSEEEDAEFDGAGPDGGGLDGEDPGTVRIIELLDEDVDLSPGRWHPRHAGQDLGRFFSAALKSFRAAFPVPRNPVPDLPESVFPVPDIEVLTSRRALPVTTVGELLKAGLVTVRHAPARMTAELTGKAGERGGHRQVLTVEDLAEGRPPSGRARYESAMVTVEAGDVVAAASGTARVIAVDGVPGSADSDGTAGHQVVGTNTVLGPYLARYRVDRQRLDPDFLAGVLRAAGRRTPSSGATRFDARRIRIPRLSLAEQQAYGRAFRQLVMFEDALRETAALGQNVVRLGFDGLVDGHLRPRD